MAVAKSYQKYNHSEPFTQNKKKYVNLLNENNQPFKTVRWYTDAEYIRMYPEEKGVDKYYRPQRSTLGFDAGFIYAFDQDLDSEYHEFFVLNKCRYNRWFKWFLEGDKTLPPDIPEGVHYTKVYWESVGGANGKLNDETSVLLYFGGLKYELC